MGYIRKRQQRKPKSIKEAQKKAEQRIEFLKNEWDKIADLLQKSNHECLIPCLAGEAHDPMNNCHVIGAKFLERLANNGKVFSWPVSVRAMGHIAIDLLKAREWQLNPPYFDIKKYPPVLLSKTNKDFKYTFACQYHDNKVFGLADNASGFNPHDAKTQFELALRSIVAHNAFYQGHKRYAEQDFDNDFTIRQNLAKHPELRPIAEMARDFGATQTTAGNQLEREITRWETAYKESDMSRIMSFATTASPKLRLAGTSIQRRKGHHIIVSILPDNQQGCAIIATAIAHPNLLPWISRRKCQSAVRQEAEAIKGLIETPQPAYWLAQLATQWIFLYVSPADYAELPEGDRTKVEESVAQKYRGVQKNLPTLR